MNRKKMNIYTHLYINDTYTSTKYDNVIKIEETRS